MGKKGFKLNLKINVLKDRHPCLFFVLATLSLIFFLFIIINTGPRAMADTDVGGPISSDRIWTLEGSPYIVQSSVLVRPDVTLTIEPGVKVYIQGGKAIQIEGALIARGTAAANIIFTAAQLDPLARWGYILFADSSMDALLDGNSYSEGSILEYCVVELNNGGDREGAVVCTNAYPLIKNGAI